MSSFIESTVEYPLRDTVVAGLRRVCSSCAADGICPCVESVSSVSPASVRSQSILMPPPYAYSSKLSRLCSSDRCPNPTRLTLATPLRTPLPPAPLLLVLLPVLSRAPPTDPISTPIASNNARTSRNLGLEASFVDQQRCISFDSARGQASIELPGELAVEGISGRLPFCSATAI
jgi:hypothetical protein